MKKDYQKKLVAASHLVILCAAISFGGWCFEMVVCRIVYGVSGDRGLLTLPVCPIYGISMLTVYLLLGTPRRAGGALARIADGWGALKRRLERGGIFRYALYFLCATAVSTLAELTVGLATRPLGIKLWDYSSRPMNFLGIVCLPYSLAWGAMITLLMSLLWERARRAVSGIPPRATCSIAFVLLFLIGSDFAASCVSACLTE